jgi:5-methylcytosine-specific restriction enzyme subunit McrC
MSIPVRNLYYLLAYAWDHLDQAGVIEVGEDDYRDLANLFGRVLAGSVRHLLKRGLDRGYLEDEQVIPGVRGKLDVSATVKSNLLVAGRTACVVDDLSTDVLHNRILRQTVRNVARAEGLDRGLRDELLECDDRLQGISPVRLSAAAFRSVQLHGNNAFYAFVLRVCRLIFDVTVVDSTTGARRFRDFVRDERQMAGLFERFVLNFYRREQRAFAVRSKRIGWQPVTGTEEHLAFLPSMKTDISLEGGEREIVIDAKFYREPTQRNFGKDSVRSAHLYQLFAYLRNLAQQTNRQVSGVLLYPQVGEPIDLRYTMHGHPVLIRTVDLAQEWRGISRELLELIATDPPG